MSAGVPGWVGLPIFVLDIRSLMNKRANPAPAGMAALGRVLRISADDALSVPSHRGRLIDGRRSRENPDLSAELSLDPFCINFASGQIT